VKPSRAARRAPVRSGETRPARRETAEAMPVAVPLREGPSVSLAPRDGMKGRKDAPLRDGEDLGCEAVDDGVCAKRESETSVREA